MKLLIALSLAVVVMVILALDSGVYNIGATEKHWAITEKMIAWVRESSIKARAEELEAPTFDEAALLGKGFKEYDAMCTECHLKPGIKPTDLAVGLYPQAPVFHEREQVTQAHEKSYLFKKYFWVIKNGVKMTAMPAWGPTHTDEEIWAIAAFVLKLPGMTAEEYAAMGEKHRHADPHDHHH